VIYPLHSSLNVYGVTHHAIYPSQVHRLLCPVCRPAGTGITSFAADAPKGSKGAAIGANDKVHCYNVHDCKGNSDCSTAEHSCKGQNACKGHGFKAKTAAQCLMEKGTIGDIKGYGNKPP
jgi:hypothetical protein